MFLECDDSFTQSNVGGYRISDGRAATLNAWTLDPGKHRSVFWHCQQRDLRGLQLRCRNRDLGVDFCMSALQCQLVVDSTWYWQPTKWPQQRSGAAT